MAELDVEDLDDPDADAEGIDEPPAPLDIAPPDINFPATPLASGRLAFYGGDLDGAIDQLTAVLKDDAYDGESRAQAMYWRAEALFRKDFAPSSVKEFEEVAREFRGHYLGAAAEERAAELHAYFESIENPYPVIEDE